MIIILTISIGPALIITFQGASVLLLQASANLQSQVRPGSSIKYKAAFTRVLYRYLCDHPTTDIIDKVPNLVLATALQDMSYIPFALDLVRCLHNTPELSAVSATIFEPLVSVFSQPDSPTTLTTLPHVLLIFQHEILYREICQPQRTLLYLAEHVLTKEVCEIISWSLGHQILSLCHSYMKEFDVTECFNELCQVLNAFISGSDDVDILDRANMYRTLLLELSESKLKELLRTPKHGPKDKVEFHSSRTVKKVDVPFLKLSKQRQTMAETVEHDHLCPQHVAKQALAIFLEVPESWGKIDPIMVGHVDRRQNKRTALDIVCFPECPYPVIAEARAEFSINNVMHLCSLEPFKLDLEDFFQPLPLLGGTPLSPSEVFACLWSHLEENCGTTSHISVHTQPCSRDEFLIRFGSLVTEELQGENSLHVAIFLPPGKHLLMKVAFKDDCAVVRLATDDIFLLAHINSYFKTWS
uniref:Adaptor-related protein complex 5 beta subunit n=1 Tax=Timema monikensis TaxID=170555 RepID=A0A7R9HR17_9NEOP|nr:unnamed protein product [Timema monikensis]